jgi:large subunit ribosomal protein L35
MPKQKTHKGAQSRFHITGSGKIMRVKGPKSHLRRRKAKRTKRLFDEKIPISSSDRKRIQKLIPHGV